MAAPPNPNLAAQLIAQLREAKSPLARIRVVTRAWRLLRNLSRQERAVVAAQIGIEGSDDLIEVIAAHQGASPPTELIGALNNLQKVDAATLKSIASKIRDPRQRGQAVVEGLKVVETALGALEASAPPPRPPAPANPRPSPAPPPPVTVKPATSWPLREAAPVAPKPAPAAPPVPAAAPAPAPASAPVAGKEPEPRRPAPPAAAPPPPSPPAPAPARLPEPPAPVRSALAEALAAVPVLTARFRLLRRRMDEVRRLSAADLRAVLEAFPDGWARRRALVDLLEAGVPERTADALSLLGALQSPGDRSWCLGTLAHVRELSLEERAALLQAAPTAAGRRRLELRLGEA